MPSCSGLREKAIFPLGIIEGVETQFRRRELLTEQMDRVQR